jgi:hypothetical protein
MIRLPVGLLGEIRNGKMQILCHLLDPMFVQAITEGTERDIQQFRGLGLVPPRPLKGF